MFCRFGSVLDRRPGGGHRLLVGGVQAALRIHQARQRVDVGRLQLRDLPVLEDEADHLVLVAQLLQDRCIGRAAGPRALRRRQRELVEQDRLELARRADVELVPDQRVDPGLEVGERRAELLAHGGERLEVDLDAGLLHPRQHREERHLDLVEQLRQAALLELAAQDRLASSAVSASAAARRAIACSSAPVSGFTGFGGSSAPKCCAARSSTVCERSAWFTM